MSKKTLSQVLLIASAVVMAAGCATTKRAVTNIAWMDSDKDNHNRLYLSYWEGSCKAFMGCSQGEAHVKLCSRQTDNGMKCEEQKEVDELLSK